MRDVSHTHPYADRGAEFRPFQRGPVVAADGGEREASDAPEEERPEEEERTQEAAEDERPDRERRANETEEERRQRMKDVDHEPPYGEGANRVFERGGAEEPVESEE